MNEKTLTADITAFTVLNGLIGTIALSIKAAGGDDDDVAGALRSFADSYESRGEHCTALRETTPG